jgi:hypothetical protein
LSEKKQSKPTNEIAVHIASVVAGEPMASFEIDGTLMSKILC